MSLHRLSGEDRRRRKRSPVERRGATGFASAFMRVRSAFGSFRTSEAAGRENATTGIVTEDSDFLRGVFRGMKDGVGDQVEFVTEDIPHFFTETAPWLVDLQTGAVPTLGHHLGEAVGCQLGKTPEDFVNDVKSGARNAADVAAVLNAIRAQDFRGLTARQREIAIAANSRLADIFAAAGRNLTSSQAEAVGRLAGTLIADFVVDSIVVGATGGVGAPKIALTLIKRIDNAPAAIRKILYPLRKGFEAGGELRKKLDRLLRTVRKSPDCKRPHAKRPGSRPNPDGDAVAGSEFLDDRIRTGDVPFDPRVTLTPKIERQMGSRGWTRSQVYEAIHGGRQIPAINKATGNPAIRYVHPTTGQSIVVDRVTGEVIHVGGPGFRYGIDSGDLPLLRPRK